MVEGRSRTPQQSLWWTYFFFSLVAAVSVSATEFQTYIVHLSRHRQGKDGGLLSHRGYLEAVLGSHEAVEQSLIYRYENIFDGFAAKLTPAQVTELSKMHGVLSVVPNTMYMPATTHSWQFLGLESSKFPNTGALWEQTKYGEDIIIGIVDTGIWPEAASFNDKGLGPIPARWKGECIEGQNFSAALNCNKKIIGARYYYAGNPDIQFAEEYNSSRDYQGHGTHVASTAGGTFVPASDYGYANGTAKGGAPRARIAVYKVCWYKANCYQADMAAAMEDAITDGVDVISISISGSNDEPFSTDVVGIASFQAMRNGILVNFAGGNSGPGVRTVNHVEPWSFTVAASTQDRYFGSDVVIKTEGSPSSPGLQCRGKTFSDYPTLTAPVIVASDAAVSDEGYASLCFENYLDPEIVKGKIVFCLKGREDESIYDKAQVVQNAGGVGMIMGNSAQLEDYTVETSWLFIPAVHVTAFDAKRILDYFNKCDFEACTFRKNVTATISKGTTFYGVKPAPVIASFSSCGPSGVTTDILKPDITAPGVDILAAWINGEAIYSMISGTSMATPHIAGVVAIVKAAHPKWSPSAIKSAIMTTAQAFDNANNRIQNLHAKPAAAFSTGSGLVNPVAAVDPGLVYDAGWQDYALFLCSLNYADSEIELITGEKGFCGGKTIPIVSDLNYPSVSIGDLTKAVTITRKVTNVGKAHSAYCVSVESPKGVKVTVSPAKLFFTKAQETKSFTIRLERTKPAFSQESYVFGSFTWSDGVHKVRSPIVVGSAPRSPSLAEGLVMSY